MNQLYVLHFFYKDVLPFAKQIQEAKKEVESISGTDYKVIGVGYSNTLAIAFLSDLDQETLQLRFVGIATPGLYFLLLKVDQIIDGKLSEDEIKWFSRNRKILRVSKPR